MKRILVLALFGLLFVVTQAGTVGTYSPDVGIGQALVIDQPVTNFQAVICTSYEMAFEPVTAEIYLPVVDNVILFNFTSDAWRNPDYAPSWVVNSNAKYFEFTAAYNTQDIPLKTHYSNWHTRTTHNYNINYSYGLRC